MRLWKQAGMPEYEMKDLQPWRTLTIYVADWAAREELIQKIDKELTPKSKWSWYPPVDYNEYSKRPERPIKTKPNKFPIYVISKGRWKTPLTAEYLERLSIPYHLVVEPQEKKQYESIVWEWGTPIDPSRILTLPHDNYGQGCSIPARNWCWRDSKKRGDKRHWILDDNIQGFYCMNHNEKHIVQENPFIPVEKFTEFFTNVPISGMNYEFMLQHRAAVDPYYLNTRVYSCILIQNDIPFEWRGVYNEDTDLCLRILKAGYCTLLLNYMQAKKIPSLKMKGGNTDVIYQGEGRKAMAMSLKAQHPDLVTVSRKYGRWQHHVDYSVFVQKLAVRRANTKNGHFNQQRPSKNDNKGK